MRKTLCASALIMIALLGAGCKKGPSLVGKWTGQIGGQTADFEFKDDNTMTIAVKNAQAGLTFLGDYKVEGDKSTLTFKDVKFSGVSESQQAAGKAMLAPLLNKPQAGKVTFASDDEVSFSNDQPAAGATAKPAAGMSPMGGSFTLKRVKE